MGWTFAWIGYVNQQYYLYKKPFIICITVTVPDPTAAAADVFGTGIFQ